MKLVIWENEDWQRFDRFLRKYFKKDSNIKLSDIYSWIRKWAILLNGKKAKQWSLLKLQDEIEIKQPDDVSKNPLNHLLTKEEKKTNIDLKDVKKQILYEDNHRIFWNKQAWTVIHPWNKHLDDLTLNDYLEQYVSQTSKVPNKSNTFTPAFGFRLDRDTSWIIVAAKTYDALKYLNKVIRERKVDKSYLAIVKGDFSDKKTITAPLFLWFNKKFGRAQSFVNKEKWLEAKTQAFLITKRKDKYLGFISLLMVNIYTWRMHQIRAHLAHIGYPVLGDIMYGDDNTNKTLENQYGITRQLLHSRKYWFFDKFNNKYLEVDSDFPVVFNKLFDKINLKDVR